MATEHRHHWEIQKAEPTPEGVNGRLVTLGCSECTETRPTVTLRTDAEIQVELDDYNDNPDDE